MNRRFDSYSGLESSCQLSSYCRPCARRVVAGKQRQTARATPGAFSEHWQARARAATKPRGEQGTRSCPFGVASYALWRRIFFTLGGASQSWVLQCSDWDILRGLRACGINVAAPILANYTPGIHPAPRNVSTGLLAKRRSQVAWFEPLRL